jgi:hypothetical protein
VFLLGLNLTDAKNNKNRRSVQRVLRERHQAGACHFRGGLPMLWMPECLPQGKLDPVAKRDYKTGMTTAFHIQKLWGEAKNRLRKRLGVEHDLKE